MTYQQRQSRFKLHARGGGSGGLRRILPTKHGRKPTVQNRHSSNYHIIDDGGGARH